MDIKKADKDDIIASEEWLTLQVEMHMEKLMEEQGVSHAELARRLGVSKNSVDNMFSGQNMTLRKISKVFMALDSSMQVFVIPHGFETTVGQIVKVTPKRKKNKYVKDRC